MLRMLVLALLLANAAYLAWTQGLLAASGFAPVRQAEPERLALQIRPEAMLLVTPGPARPPARLAATLPAASSAAPSAAPFAVNAAVRAAIGAAAPTPGAQCLQVGAFTEKQAALLRQRLRASLPADSWSFESSGESVRWIIYMGKYISRDAMNRKRLKLEQLGLSFEAPASPLLNPGLSLGSFGAKADAENALAQIAKRGLRSAKVVLEHPELPTQWLRLPQADAPLRAKLESLKPLLADKSWQPCSSAPR
jgi:hypothetical protein